MSGSETVRATGAGDDPVEALRDALFQVARALAARGAGPAHLAAMTWSAPDPGAIHPSRRAVDLACREVFGGTRPPVRVTRVVDGVVAVEAAFAVPPALDAAAAKLLRDFTPRVQVPNIGALFGAWAARGEAFRRRHAALDLAYGPSAAETLDLYRPAGVVRPPVWVFVHGGYWQATAKGQHAQFAAGMLAAGFAVANVEYGFAPQVPLDALVAQVRAAIGFLAREADALDLDADRINLAGHSAGAHLAAMALLEAGGSPIRSALLLSGLFDLAPLAALPVGRLLGLDPAAVARLSPASSSAPPGVALAVAVGGAESEAFLDQSRLIAERWDTGAPLVVPGANHFDLLEGLNGGALLDLARATAG